MFSLSENVGASMTLDCQETNCLRGLNNRMNMPFHLQDFARKHSNHTKREYSSVGLIPDATRPIPVEILSSCEGD